MAGPTYKGGDAKARQLKLGNQNYGKEKSYRHTTGLSQPTPNPSIQDELGKGIEAPQAA